MVSAELCVAEYKSNGQSMRHWAIHLRITNRGKKDSLIYQADGEEGNLNINIRQGVVPSTSLRFHKEVFVSDIDDQATLDEVKERLAAQPMQNKVSAWNCQDWVMEALDTLESEGLLDTYKYHDAKEELVHDYHK